MAINKYSNDNGIKFTGMNDFMSIRDVHNKRISDVQWNCDGSYLGTASDDKSVRISQLDMKTITSKVIQTIPCPIPTKLVCWDPTTPNSFAIAGNDKTVRYLVCYNRYNILTSISLQYLPPTSTSFLEG